MENRIIALIPIIEGLFEVMEIPIINPVVPVNITRNLIIITHVNSIQTLDLMIRENQILVDWKGQVEANITAKLPREQCMLSRNICLKVGRNIPKTFKLKYTKEIYVWRIEQQILLRMEIFISYNMD